MSRRRISSSRRRSHMNRASSGSGVLEEDSNIFDTDDPLWYKRMEGNNTVLRPSLQLSCGEESSAVLDSGSDVDMPPPQVDWWNPLGKFNQTINQVPEVGRTIDSSGNAEQTADNTALHEDSVDSLPQRDPRKRKRTFLGSQKRESLGGTAFLNVLNESATTVISDPGPSKRSKSILKTSFLSDEDSFKKNNSRQSGNYKADEKTFKFGSPLKTRKSRPAIFSKIRTIQSDSTSNVFNNLLENISANSESSTLAVNKTQQTRTLNDSQKFVVQDTKEISQDEALTVNQKKISKDIEQSMNSDENLSKRQRTTRSSSKTADTSISSNSKAKTSVTEEQKENSTFDSNSSGVELKKKRPGLFRRTRKSIETNAFDSIFTSEGESIQEVVKSKKSQTGNSSATFLEKDREEKNNETNLSKSQSRRLTSFEEANKPESKLQEREDLSDSNSEIDVEYKNDESTKSSKDGSLQSPSRNRKSHQSSQMKNASQNNSQEIFHKIPVAPVNRSKYTLNLSDSEEEDLISVGSQGIVEQSNQKRILSTSKKHNSSINKSRGTSQNSDNSKGSSRLNESIKIPERLSIFAEEPQYESTRKLEIQKFNKRQESSRISKLNSGNNEDRSKEFPTVELPIGTATSIDHSRHFSSRKTFEDEEASDIEVSAKKRKSRSQYESPKKIEILKSRTSQSRQVSNFDSANIEDRSKNSTGNKSTEQFSRNVFSNRQTSDDEEMSDIEVSDPKNVVSTEKNRNASRHSKSKSKNNETRSEENSGGFANNQNQSMEKEGSVDSERSHTISLSEGGSMQSEVPSDNNLPLTATLQSNNQSTKISSNKRYGTSFIPSDSDSDEENLEENSLSKKKTAKAVITGFEILKPNDIDVRKLKGIEKVAARKKNTSITSRSPSAVRDIPVSNTVKKSPIITKNSQKLIEEEFRRLHGEENSEIASTSRQHSQVSRNLFTKDVDSNKSSSDLRKILEDEVDSEVSESPLLIYSENIGEEDEESEYEETSPVKDLKRKTPSIVKADLRDRKQKMIYDYFKFRDAQKTQEKSQPQKISFSQAAGNKDLMANVKKQVENIIAPIKEELFKKPKEPEPPKRKLFVAKGTSKKKESKPVDPAYLVNGVVYKKPKLPRPKRWATDHLYKFIWKKIEPKYGGRTRVRSEKFVLRLTQVVNTVMRLTYKNYVEELDSLTKEMARLGLIVTLKDFNDFCIEFLPYEFRVKATPILLPGNKMSIPYDPKKFYAPILSDDSH